MRYLAFYCLVSCCSLKLTACCTQVSKVIIICLFAPKLCKFARLQQQYKQLFTILNSLQLFITLKSICIQTGTLNYLAPELLMRDRTYTSAIDVWGAGCVFGEMALRRKLFPGNDANDVLYIIVEQVSISDTAFNAKASFKNLLIFLK